MTFTVWCLYRYLVHDKYYQQWSAMKALGAEYKGEEFHSDTKSLKRQSHEMNICFKVYRIRHGFLIFKITFLILHLDLSFYPNERFLMASSSWIDWSSPMAIRHLMEEKGVKMFIS